MSQLLPIAAEKPCSGCQLIKPLEDFYRDASKRDGRSTTCKVCKYSNIKKQRTEVKAAATLPSSHKICATCKESNVIDDFGKNVAMTDGKNVVCRACISVAGKKFRLINQDLLQREADKLRARDQQEMMTDKIRIYGQDLDAARKRCCTCKEEHALTHYYAYSTNPDGLDPRCKNCRAKSDKLKDDKNAERSDEEIKLARDSKHPDGTKTCSNCEETLPLDEYHVAKANQDGLGYECKRCVHIRSVKASMNRANFRDSLKEGKCCENCGCDNLLMLDFAHIDRSTKRRSVTGKPITPSILRPSLLAIEVAQTKILCAFCHRLETAQENKTNWSMTASAIWYRAQRDNIRETTSDAEKLRRGQCLDCWRKVTRDHLPQYEKRECIAEMVSRYDMYTSEDIIQEMAKCELRCVNCHRVKTVERRVADG
jgi:hypothetical protein